MFICLLCVCMCVGAHRQWPEYGGHRTTRETWYGSEGANSSDHAWQQMFY